MYDLHPWRMEFERFQRARKHAIKTNIPIWSLLHSIIDDLLLYLSSMPLSYYVTRDIYSWYFYSTFLTSLFSPTAAGYTVKASWLFVLCGPHLLSSDILDNVDYRAGGMPRRGPLADTNRCLLWSVCWHRGLLSVLPHSTCGDDGVACKCTHVFNFSAKSNLLTCLAFLSFNLSV